MPIRKVVLLTFFNFIILPCTFSSAFEQQDANKDPALKENTETLHLNTATVVSVSGNSLLIFSLDSTSVPPVVAFLVLQVHTQFINVTLSAYRVVSQSTAVYGRDIGMITVVKSGDESWSWYLYNNNSETVNVLVHAASYTDKDPMPGGCNEEFNLENDPNLHLHLTSDTATLQYQWSNVGHSSSAKTPPDCEDRKFQSYLQYDIHVYYIPGNDFSEDTYFKTLKKMITPENIVDHAPKIKMLRNNAGQKSLQKIASYKRQGVIYGIVVRQKSPTTGVETMATYVPIVTYMCRNKENCQQMDVAAAMLSAVGGVIGLFLCFFGHRFFRMENFIFGFLAFSIVFYQVFVITTDIDHAGILALTGGFGLIGGALLLAFWWYAGIPVLSVLFIGLVLGYLFSSILFYTPLGNLSYWDSQFNYGMSFTCGVLILPVLLLCVTRIFNIVCCAVVGAYGVILTVDTFLNSGMRYIVLNSLRHGTSPDYLKVLVAGPYTLLEIILTVVWFLLVVGGFTFQYIRERNKAPFPPCPRIARRRTSLLRDLLRADTHSPSRDREPLLRGDNQRGYGATKAEFTDETGTESERELNQNA